MLNLLYRVVSFNPVRTLTFNRSLPVEDPEPQIPILDQWHQAALTSVPQFKREVDLLWGRTVTSVLGASPIDEDRQHFQALLEPLLKLSSTEGADQLNGMDIAPELSLLATVLAGKAPGRQSNVDLLRACMDGILSFNTAFLDIPWSTEGIVFSARDQLAPLSVRTESISDDGTLNHSEMPLLDKIAQIFDSIDPTIHRTPYLVEGSIDESQVKQAFNRVRNEFVVWASTTIAALCVKRPKKIVVIMWHSGSTYRLLCNEYHSESSGIAPC